MTVSNTHSLQSPNLRWLLVGLLVISTVLYVAAVTIERNSSGEQNEAPAVQPAASGEGQEGHSEAGETQTDSGTTTKPDKPEVGNQERLFGIDLESPWLIVAAVVVSIALIGALFLFERTALVLILVFSIAATALDILEVATQAHRSNSGLALLALLVALGHVALGVSSVFTMIQFRKRGSQHVSGTATA